MHCQDAKLALAAQHDGDLAPSDVLELQEHLKHCPACRAYEQRQGYLDSLVRTPPPYARSRISTERIMLAIQQQKRITQQLEDIRSQQRSREARLRVVGPLLAAVVVLTLSGLPLLLLAAAIFQPDLMVNTLTWLSDAVGVLIVLAQYIQAGLLLVTRNNLLLSGLAFVLVVMMATWLRLMRHPQEV
jgi:predicted anti-sigma-YlaC factor YlaD